MIYIKSYITMKETPYYLQNGIFLKIPSHTLRDMEQIQFYFEHVQCGIRYNFLLNKVNHSLNLNSKLNNGKQRLGLVFISLSYLYQYFKICNYATNVK